MLPGTWMCSSTFGPSPVPSIRIRGTNWNTMTDKQKDFVVELTAGAILLLLGVFVFATD